MYKRINKKLKIYKNICKFINLLVRLITILILALFFYFLQKNNSSINLKNNNIISNVIEKPKLQTYENDGDVILVVGDKAEIEKDKINVYNLKVDSNFLTGFSNVVNIINDGDEIIFNDRPMIIFYNEKDN